MEQTTNYISAEELFGATSQLAEQVEELSLSGIASLGIAYQSVTALVALLFIFILVRHFNLFQHLIVSSISKQSNRSDIHIYSADIKNIEIVTNGVGVLLLSLMVMRLSVMEGFHHILASFSAWELGGMTFGGILVILFGERILLYIVGAVSEQNELCSAIWQTKLLHFSLVIVLLSPLLILSLLTEGTITRIALNLSVAICLLSLILFIKETFLLFRAQRFSIFHWILYLCALEIFPLSLLLAPIARG